MQDVFNGMFATLQQNVDREQEGDYTDGTDGLLHCGTCKEPKQLRLTMPENIADALGKERIVYRSCACQRARIQAEEDAFKQQEAHRRIEQLRKKGLANSQYKECTFAADDQTEPKIRDMCLRYVEQRKKIMAENIGMALVGDVGTGKTFWAAAIANALIDQGMEALMTTIPQLTAAMTADYGDEREYVLDQIRRVPFLILDDVGFERNTSFAMEKAYEIVNERYKAKKPLIITTNMSKEELQNPSGLTDTRIFDRIIEMCPAIVEVRGKRRKGIAEGKRLVARDILFGERKEK